MSATLVIWLIALHAPGGQQGAVTTVTGPPTVTVGSPITIGVTGKNPCTAVHIDWGDGEALTYRIPDLSTTQTHTYDRPGRYAIVARGRGNCGGGTTFYVRVDPAPSSDRPQLSSFTVSEPAPVGSPIGVTAFGTGRCRLTVDFGDGQIEEFTVPLPHTVRHVYTAPGTYEVVARANEPCEGRHSVKLGVQGQAAGSAAAPSSRLLGMKIAPNPAAPRNRIAITLDGRGRCSLTVDFGDGSDQALETSLPVRITHTFARPGVYEIYAWVEEPCTGEATGSIRVRRPAR